MNYLGVDWLNGFVMLHVGERLNYVLFRLNLY